MARKKKPLSEQLRAAILDADCSRYAIFKATGIDQSALSKFVHGERTLSLNAIDRIAEFLELELVKKGK
ncbi:helix-turn-helix domain-containing protein [Bythopirellula polymerisocia]|uniref:Helix-turn-helix protein n=1 Tax=Bythopirellula polymerisocia TaxID=2528003 RepID=A0A5C6CVR6_9BACT|nr:helix-turn-helix transcriptional regulator [Bythopirellula polymerisocia]TWU27597.1 helix-turn-helix protein [Bythopirellula polymerisocia]